ncbi:hypothetical protein G7Y89_g2183 [Cudoniella acicularis]|uniref:Uncharacterized protein n=1 Tax=Cudoniella acicularis TaxID=354080 RepID=A0A8H4W8V5_9HELO|nr:hypothetical protein G7Y89_g2183 [Cudoniella acicularis]
MSMVFATKKSGGLCPKCLADNGPAENDDIECFKQEAALSRIDSAAESRLDHSSTGGLKTGSHSCNYLKAIPNALDEGWQNGLLIGTMYYVFQGMDNVGRKNCRTRMFEIGLEDPGTGSASCGLGCLLALQEAKEEGNGPIGFAFTQGIEMGRRNEIDVEVTRNAVGTGIKKVVMSGSAVKASLTCE